MCVHARQGRRTLSVSSIAIVLYKIYIYSSGMDGYVSDRLQ